MSKVRVLVVDDSAVVRRLMSKRLAEYPDIEVIATAKDAFDARDKVLALNPDVLTLDIEMPKVDGLTFLEKLMAQHPKPVVVVSSIAEEGGAVAMRALTLGAIDVVAKPGSEHSVVQDLDRIAAAIRGASVARLTAVQRIQRRSSSLAPKLEPGVGARAEPHPQPRLVAIGASTGGTNALERVLQDMQGQGPPIVVVQHMPKGFTAAFADRLNASTPFRVVEAQDRQPLQPGHVYIAPAGFHLEVRGSQHLRTRVVSGPPVQHHVPSVDVLFHSIANVAGNGTIAALLTGMGHDGAKGLLALRRAGAVTIAESEKTCVVFGMPRVAIEMDAAQLVLPLGSIGRQIDRFTAKCPTRGQRLTSSPPA